MKRYEILKRALIICVFAFYLTGFTKAQNIGDYQSATTGNWSVATNWQTWNGSAWIAAPAPPTVIISGQTVSILSGNTITNNLTTVSNSGTIIVSGTLLNSGTPFTINSGGSLIVAGSMTNSASKTITNNGIITTNSSFTNNGTIINNLTLEVNNNFSSTVNITNNGTITVASGITFTNTGAVSNNGVVNNNGTFLQNNICSNALAGTINNSGIFTILSGKTLNNIGTFNNAASGVLNINTVAAGTGKLTNDGTIVNAGNIINLTTTGTVNYFLNNSGSIFINSGTIQNTTITALKFGANSLYQHNYSSLSALPTTGKILPYATYDPASTCEILSFGNGSAAPNSTTIPTTLQLGNLIWNNASQPANITLNARLSSIKGNFTVQNTNGFNLILNSSTGGNSLIITGNLTVSGSGKLVITNGSTNPLLSITGNLIISGGELDLSTYSVSAGNGNATINLSGNLVHTAGNIKKSGISSGTINAVGTGQQTIESIGFATGNLITFNTQTATSGSVAVAPSKTFVINQGTTFNVNENTASTANDFTVDGTLQVSGTINVLPNASIAMGTIPMTDAASASGNFILNSGATLLTKHPDGISASGATGSIQTSGTRTLPVNANYTFNAATAQVTGNGLPTTLTGILTINNSTALSSAGVSLSQAITITGGSLNLTAGRLITSSSSLITIDTGTAITPTGGSAFSFIDGPVSKIGFTAGTEFIFPTGDTAKWARIGFTPSSTNTSLAFTAEYFKRDPHTYVDPSSFADSTLNRPSIKVLSYREYWYLNRTNGSTDGKVKLYWEDASFSGISSALSTDLRVAHYKTSGPQWYAEGTSPIVTTGSIQTQAAVTTFTGTYPYFTFGAPGPVNPLPIELLAFHGMETDNGNIITWSTASETNNDHFELERGINGYSFEKIAGIEGSGNSTSVLNYSYLDADHGACINYYRLKQIDYNGQFSYSNIISINNNKTTETFVNAYPNPVTDNSINISFSENINSIVIYNILGDEIFHSDDLTNDKAISADILAKGVYIVKAITSEQKLITTKFTKQ